MTAITLCVLAFAASYWAGRRSLVQGLLTVLAVGYSYGILRANVLSSYSHFIFDASLSGLYLSQLCLTPDRAGASRTLGLRLWTIVLIAWPALVCLLPFQPLAVSLVGFRGNAFFLPCLLLGCRMKSKDVLHLSFGLVALNLVALGFALAEYVVGVEFFYPLSPVTALIYQSRDAGGEALRIPATFANAHAYAGTMVGTLPFLLGAWVESANLRRSLLLFGSVAALLGVVLASTRVYAALAAIMVLACLPLLNWRKRFIWLTVTIMVGYFVLGTQRFERLKSLAEVDVVAERISGSVNRSFGEVLLQYPMGNGLGGGGTSIPYFLQGQIRDPVGIENEYARILLEQGIIGLLLWISFILWVLAPSTVRVRHILTHGRKLGWLCAICGFGAALIGTGMLTAIPNTFLSLLTLGWIAVLPPPEDVEPERSVSWGWVPAAAPSASSP